MNEPPAPPWIFGAGVSLAALVMFFVSAEQGWRWGALVSAGVAFAVAWETSTYQRQRGSWHPHHRDRPWRRDPE